MTQKSNRRGIVFDGNQKPRPSNVRPPATPKPRPVGAFSNSGKMPKKGA